MNRISSYIRRTLQGMYPPEEVNALVMMIYCDILKLDALDIYLGKDIQLSESKQGELENIIGRLQNNEPIQYIRGTADFCGRTFYVAPGVLIPRPETAELVELIAKENVNADSIRVLDIGTGSGCIAISLAKYFLKADVTAWDVSGDALKIACRNNEALRAQVRFVEQDVFSDIAFNENGYDIIVSNPPYITESEKQMMESNVLDWEPETALFVPNDEPLRFYDRIAEVGQKILNPDGKLYFEINQAYGDKTACMLETKGYRNIRVIKDFYKRDRIVTANK